MPKMHNKQKYWMSVQIVMPLLDSLDVENQQ